jgi:hypothetical protein
VAALAMAERRRNMAVVGGSGGPLLVPLVYRCYYGSSILLHRPGGQISFEFLQIDRI